jgi:hypothetical protein
MSRREQRKAFERWREQTRRAAVADARTLAIDIAAGRDQGLTGYGMGIVLSAGETVWRELDAGYFVLDTYSHIHHHHGWSGNIDRSYEVTDKRWTNHGVLRWLVTNQRLASRYADGELISIYWVDPGGCQIDLDAEYVILDSHKRTRYCLTGPAAPVIAVAAVSSLHGAHALIDHPGLGPLRARPNSSRTAVGTT